MKMLNRITERITERRNRRLIRDMLPVTTMLFVFIVGIWLEIKSLFK